MLDRLRFVPIRLLQAIPVVFGVTSWCSSWSTCCPATRRWRILGQTATPERVAALQHQLGPGQAAVGPVLALPGPAVPRRPGHEPHLPAAGAPSWSLDAVPITLSLLAYALVLSLLISVPLALAGGLRAGRAYGTMASGPSPWSARACPSSGSASCCILLLRRECRAVPGRRVRRDARSSTSYYLFLPALTLAIAMSPDDHPQPAGLHASTCSGADYVGTARSKGAAGSRCSAGTCCATRPSRPSRSSASTSATWSAARWSSSRCSPSPAWAR